MYATARQVDLLSAAIEFPAHRTFLFVTGSGATLAVYLYGFLLKMYRACSFGSQLHKLGAC